MSIVPVTPHTFDVPNQITIITGKIQGRGLSVLGELEAIFLFRTMRDFHGGEFHYTDSSPEPLLYGDGGQVIRRQKEASEATKAALKMTFGPRYHEDACKEKIRKCLAFVTYGNKEDQLPSREIAKVERFFKIWHGELSKFPLSA